MQACREGDEHPHETAVGFKPPAGHVSPIASSVSLLRSVGAACRLWSLGSSSVQIAQHWGVRLSPRATTPGRMANHRRERDMIS